MGVGKPGASGSPRGFSPARGPGNGSLGSEPLRRGRKGIGLDPDMVEGAPAAFLSWRIVFKLRRLASAQRRHRQESGEAWIFGYCPRASMSG
jgi:hypothetical protein